MPRSVPGLRLLIAEDSALIGMALEEAFTDEGWSIAGPFLTCADALAAASVDNLDGALIDLHLSDSLAYPVTAVLTSRNIPFVVMTGDDAQALQRANPDWVICSKPFLLQEIVSLVGRHIVGQLSQPGR